MEVQNESIFVSCLRGFCRSLFVCLGIFVAIVLAVVGISSLVSPYQPEEKTTLVLKPDLNGKSELAPLSAPVILQMKIHGVVGEPDKLDAETVENILIQSREGILKNDRVKAVLLHFNTPGGTVVDSDDIYRMILKYKKKFNVPVYAYIDGLCASGGMYIASAVDKIFCSPSSIVGSVGVILGPFFNVSDALTKIGVESRTLTQGLDKDMMNPLRPWKPDEDASLSSLTAFFYQQFCRAS